MNRLVAVCLLLAVADLGFGAGVGETCYENGGRQDRTRTTPNEPFPCRSIAIPVKVRCDGSTTKVVRRPDPEEARIVSEVREKQKAQKSAVAPTERPAAEATAATVIVSKKDAMAAECEQCEIQIKANGDGLLLRCRKCHPTDSDGLRFPNATPNRVLQLP